MRCGMAKELLVVEKLVKKAEGLKVAGRVG
jgi:hypothetical protein